MQRQIDFEELIGKSTVAELARQQGVCRQRAYAAVDAGHVRVDRSKRPMRVTGGELMLSHDEWRKALSPVLDELAPGIWSFTAAGELSVLCRDAVVRVFRKDATMEAVRQTLDQIQRLNCGRKKVKS